MHRTRFLPVAAALAATGALLAPTAALAGGRPLSTDLIGAEEVLPADSDGMGTAHIWVNSGLGEICYHLEVANLDMVVGAHIHRAPAGVAGPIVVPLAAPTAGTSSGCAEVDPALAKEIRKSPEAFYVNVHTDVYPAGAIRGQLG
jgi:hypothetical protein